MLRKQYSLLSQVRWAPWWEPYVRPTPHVRGGSIAPGTPKFFPLFSYEGTMTFATTINATIQYLHLREALSPPLEEMYLCKQSHQIHC